MSDDAFMAISDHFTKLIEVSAGHREKAIAAGFSKEIAEAMALQIHEALMEVLTSRTRKR
jgi:hypothetical protein